MRDLLEIVNHSIQRGVCAEYDFEFVRWARDILSIARQIVNARTQREELALIDALRSVWRQRERE